MVSRHLFHRALLTSLLLLLFGCPKPTPVAAPEAESTSLLYADPAEALPGIEAMLGPRPELGDEQLGSTPLTEALDLIWKEIERAREAEDVERAICLFDDWQAVTQNGELTKAEEAAASVVDRLETGQWSCPPEVESPTPYRTSDAYNTIRVFYGTDRVTTDTVLPSERYGNAPRCPATEGDVAIDFTWSEACLEVGSLEVSIPSRHEPGEIETPSIWRLEFKFDPAKHIVVGPLSPVEPDPWMADLRAEIEATDGRQVFVYIHGYYNSFHNAAARTAQIANDLNFDGAATMYTWASAGTPQGYWRDEKQVRAAVPHLAAFLHRVASESGAERVHVIGHSMGNRALAPVLAGLAEEGISLDEVILAAPDIDARVFADEVVPAMTGAARRYTLYTNDSDRALIASRFIHRNRPRAGQTGAIEAAIPGFDTIDASRADTNLLSLGHAYFANKASILTDITEIIRGATPGAERSWLTPWPNLPGSAWIYDVKQ